MALSRKFKNNDRQAVIHALQDLEEEKKTGFVPFFVSRKKGNKIELTDFERRLFKAGNLGELGEFGKRREDRFLSPVSLAPDYMPKLTLREKYESLSDYFLFVEGIGLPPPEKLTDKQIKEILDVIFTYILRPKFHDTRGEYQHAEGDMPLPSV